MQHPTIFTNKVIMKIDINWIKTNTISLANSRHSCKIKLSVQNYQEKYNIQQGQIDALSRCSYRDSIWAEDQNSKEILASKNLRVRYNDDRNGAIKTDIRAIWSSYKMIAYTMIFVHNDRLRTVHDDIQTVKIDIQ